MSGPLLQVDALQIRAGGQALVEDLDLVVHAGEWLALVGESGSGKSLTALATLGLLPAGVRVASGHIWWQGADVLAMTPAALRAVRGRGIGFVFQEPQQSLDPVMSAGAQVDEVLTTHLRLSAPAARARTVALLGALGIPDPAAAARVFPHQLSGGMRQRVALAVALACEPPLLIADEPTTALDPLLAGQLLDLVEARRRAHQLAVLWITHDLASVRGRADRVAVLYAGQLAEVGPAAAVFAAPLHPYTKALLACHQAASAGRWVEIAGSVPAGAELPAGCRFHPRCPVAEPRCRQEAPPLLPGHAVGGRDSRRAACWAVTPGQVTPRDGLSGS